MVCDNTRGPVLFTHTHTENHLRTKKYFCITVLVTSACCMISPPWCLFSCDKFERNSPVEERERVICRSDL